MSAKNLPSNIPLTLPPTHVVYWRKKRTNPGNPLSPTCPDRRIGWIKVNGKCVAYQWYEEERLWKLVTTGHSRLEQMEGSSFMVA
jgi:hypothetical protein